MHVLPGFAYRYRFEDRACTVTAVNADAHRATILLDDGRVVQEVPYSDLLPPAEPPAPPPPKTKPRPAAAAEPPPGGNSVETPSNKGNRGT